MEKITNFFKKMSVGQRIYSALWALTGILLVVLIAFLGSFAGTKEVSEINLVASFGFIFVLFLIFSVFFTVFVQYRKSQNDLKKKGGKNE